MATLALIYTTVFQYVKSKEVLKIQKGHWKSKYQKTFCQRHRRRNVTRGMTQTFASYNAHAMAHSTTHKPTTHNGGGRPLPWYGMSSSTNGEKDDQNPVKERTRFNSARRVAHQHTLRARWLLPIPWPPLSVFRLHKHFFFDGFKNGTVRFLTNERLTAFRC